MYEKQSLINNSERFGLLEKQTDKQ